MRLKILTVVVLVLIFAALLVTLSRYDAGQKWGEFGLTVPGMLEERPGTSQFRRQAAQKIIDKFCEEAEDPQATFNKLGRARRLELLTEEKYQQLLESCGK